jgi:hypothetical protein
MILIKGMMVNSFSLLMLMIGVLYGFLNLIVGLPFWLCMI